MLWHNDVTQEIREHDFEPGLQCYVPDQNAAAAPLYASSFGQQTQLNGATGNGIRMVLVSRRFVIQLHRDTNLGGFSSMTLAPNTLQLRL